MIKPNWDIFKAKFTEHRRATFEWFCYLLFCAEFEKPFGILRYKNQSAIETDPIEKDGITIGWQAKFYETTLSNHKDDVVGTIEKAKRDYPTISRIVFYTNQEWGQTKGKEPQGKKDVEAKAKKLGIDLDWRSASFFESAFVAIDNEIISKHFFTLDKSIFDLIKEQQKHAENVLNHIQTRIEFNGQSIEINRGNYFDQLKEHSGRVVILSGVGGVGKTAVIKGLYEQLKENTPFFIFKATEFEIKNIDDLFTGFNLQAFLEFHKEASNKIIVIDSAEKLLDLKNTDPFKEFLAVLIAEKWGVIFTARDSYLEDLNSLFFEIYRILPLNINIKNLEAAELHSISDKYNFTLPKDDKLLNLIRNPFYLNEYLRFYKKDEQTSYIEFKDKLWNKIIRKSKPAREICFLKMAFERASSGQFFITPQCDSQILDDELKKDGILGYELPGYFITHDIYEEWALGKIIEREHTNEKTNKTFFDQIGSSRPMRRSFRSWLSEKLLLKKEEIKSFIEESIVDKDIESFWKDEILVAVLLSDYAKNFFDIFRYTLLAEGQELLKKLTFLLRIACKEVDDDFFKQMGIKDLDLLSLEYVLTKPRGEGWKALIRFVFENLNKIGIENVYFILPVIYEWNSKYKEGETTRFSSLIALKFYEWIIQSEVYISRDDTKAHLIETILYGASEVSGEMQNILQQVIKNKWKHHRDPFYELSRAILSKLEGISAARVLPKYVLQLADLFWSYAPREYDRYYDSPIGVAQYFGMEEDHLEYFPASSYQTPIYWLLQSALKETIDFILEFTNKAVETFAKSEFARHEVEEVEVYFGEKTIKQYISTRLWCTYRGTQVSPHALESMHMALEKFFLETGKHADSKTLEGWLLYLLSQSKSASISGVVTSIVLAYPEKTFNVAAILFRTKEFYFYDTNRLILDQTQKSSLLMQRSMFGSMPKNEFHEDERLKACDDKHRQFSLEHLFLKYQFFRSEETSEEEADRRQKILWDILDAYYKQLPNTSEEDEADKTWKLYLARMDRRKMKPTTEKTEEGILINFNPEIDPELKEYSEKSLERSAEPMKYGSLRAWASYKIRNDDKHKEKQYAKYEINPKLALQETKEIITKLKAIGETGADLMEDGKGFYLFNHSIPADVCSVLMRDYSEKLSEEERNYCKDIILQYAGQAFKPNYKYQVSDGSSSAISVLPVLFQQFPAERKDIKLILFLTLFDDYPVDMAGTSFHAFSIMAIHKLWEKHFEDAHSMFLGYLLLKPRFEALREKIRRENRKRNVYTVYEDEILTELSKEYESELEKVINNQINAGDLPGIKDLDLFILKTAFQMIPLKTANQDHKKIAVEIISAFSEKLFIWDREDRIDYKVRHDFLEKLAYLVLSAKKEEIREYLKPVLDKFGGYELVADLFKEFIYAEDYLNTYENFWEVWELFKNKMFTLCKKGDSYSYIDRIIKGYLFALNDWKETATEWHSFKNENKTFFKEVAEELGHCPSALYALARLLNKIGAYYSADGVYWITDILKKHKIVPGSRIEADTVYYLERFIRRFIYNNRENIKRSAKLKEDVLTILDSLIERGSVVGYILRETIL